MAEEPLVGGGWVVRRGEARPSDESALATRAVKSASGTRFLVTILDDPGTGFLDPLPVTPRGGNSATTLGAARRQALDFALALWAESLPSGVPIRLSARFQALGGSAEGATLGFGGPGAYLRDFPGAPLAETYYPSALADKLAGQDLLEQEAYDVELVFNEDVDGPVVFGAAGFDYGLEDRPSAGEIGFLRVVAHELAHGLGFLSSLDAATGAPLLGRPDVYLTRLVLDGSPPRPLAGLSSAERWEALQGTEVFFEGPAVAAASLDLNVGRNARGGVRLDGSEAGDGGPLSHFAAEVSPDQLVEPSYESAAELAGAAGLTRAVLADLGWGAAPDCAPAPGTDAPLLDERFDDGDAVGWTFVDVGTVAGPGAWSVVAGQLSQTSSIGGDAAQRGTYAAWSGGGAWTDYRARLQLRSTDRDEVGVMFRVQDANNFYRFDLDSRAGERRLVKVVNGVLTQLGREALGYTQNETLFLEVEAVGNQLKARVDGRTVLTATDSTFAAGTLAVSMFENSGATVDRVLVTRPTAAPTVLLTDDFGDANFNGWTKVDIGTVSTPSSWSASSKALRQTANIHTDPANLGRGTLAHWAGGSSWANPHLGVALWSGDDDQISVFVRYQSPTNHYRFDWDKQRAFRRLVKVTNGVLTELARDTVPYVTNERYWVELSAYGDRLRLSIDGVEIFSVRDSDLLAGSVAVGCLENAGSSFDDVVVTEAVR